MSLAVIWDIGLLDFFTGYMDVSGKKMTKDVFFLRLYA